MKGTIAASGMALAPLFIASPPELFVIRSSVADASHELERFRQAVSLCGLRIKRLVESMDGPAGPQAADILDFQLLLLEDSQFIGKIEELISGGNVNSEYAVKCTSDEYISYLEGLTDNDYLRERAADVSDLSQRLMFVLLGAEPYTHEPEGAYIATGKDIAPSLVAEMDKSKLKGIILEKGGLTSHCVILSKSLGIPCLIETTGILEAAKAGGIVLLDAVTGEATVNPDNAQIRAYNKYIAVAAGERSSLADYISHESRTLDGAVLKVYANITAKAEAEALISQGAEGVGLFRTELLFMAQREDPPSEEKQYLEYSETAKALCGRPLIIRTLDIGGDKPIEYLNIDKEDNPYLGYRAIRFCLDHPDVFKPQISAILRAGAVGNVWMMYPMITCQEEIFKAKQIVDEVKADLALRKVAYDPKMRIGIMVETPAAAYDADRLASHADFFSIGTNDLSQYLFAADRSNPKVADLNSYYQPTLLRVVNSVAASAHKAGIEVDVCGQAAESELLIPLWVAMGIDNLSVSAPCITGVRRRICNLRKSDCVELLSTVLRLNSVKEVEWALSQFL